jgi:hypothetical protein
LVCAHPNDVFYFQDVGEVNGIHVPFTIGIQTPRQFQAMFGTNDMKYHLFTLMVFDFHQTWVPIAWVIMSRQTCENLVE